MKPLTPEIVFFDIDETLHRKKTQYMPESAVDAIKALHERGIHTAIATGRAQVILPPHINHLFTSGIMDTLISINGQYNCRFDDGERVTLSHHPLDPAMVERLITLLRKRDFAYAAIAPDAVALSTDHSRIDAVLDGISGQHIDPDYALNNPIYQMLLFTDEAETQALVDDEAIAPNLDLIRWHQYCTDVLNTNGAKARGIRDVCAAMNIPLERTMAFGDGFNDIEMMQTVGFGVAMGDARDPVKAAANYITGTVEEHGIANALYDLGVLNK
ncbi:Cof-type HAD-IIB family hydrolase [Suttonella sp. R2A3]|uniref:Cof-type HAD-IIB family hydrolase n=1 Tax=Suttonella sp. R2A3 TaxID=2908648 RepID=UPI001F35CFEA|nr:Cof-type HAD-IIB family hydrolase [Suttonella sp. R2A3]UJF23689.1 Cof-type HAD-IIB family hydrolase [Suttonella sp. R2A3]